MKRANTLPATLVALALVALLPGCGAPIVIASAGLGALQTGTTAFIRGELESADNYPLEIMHQAARRAINDLQMPIVSERIGRDSGSIIARETEGRAVKIFLERKSPIVTKLNIRVGVWGDQAVSRLVQQSILERLPESYTVPEPPVPPEATPARDRPFYQE